MLSIKVTKIGTKYHARLLEGTKVLDEMACRLRIDIGWICREMLRWNSKSGSDSKWADFARKNQQSNPIGKIWWQNQLR